ncbi:MAG TPA: hypothetical protein VLM75_06955 [Spirochaetota bacterium]|nr:hypothetical protein [Spirochaetota bacterium]
MYPKSQTAPIIIRSMMTAYIRKPRMPTKSLSIRGMTYRNPTYRTHSAAPRYSIKRMFSRTADLPAAIAATPPDEDRITSGYSGVNEFEAADDECETKNLPAGGGGSMLLTDFSRQGLPVFNHQPTLRPL